MHAQIITDYIVPGNLSFGNENNEEADWGAGFYIDWETLQPPADCHYHRTDDQKTWYDEGLIKYS